MKSVEPRKMAKGFVRAVATLSLATVGFMLNPNYADVTDTGPVRLILDSAEVQQLISQQESFGPKEREELDHYGQDLHRFGPECDRQPTGEACRRLEDGAQYIPERVAFLKQMGREPAVLVATKSYCRVLKRSSAICRPSPIENPAFVKVRITTGPSKGTEGWGCEGVNVFGAWAMP